MLTQRVPPVHTTREERAKAVGAYLRHYRLKGGLGVRELAERAKVPHWGFYTRVEARTMTNDTYNNDGLFIFEEMGQQ